MELELGAYREKHSIAFYHLTLVREVNWRDIELLLGDVLPDIHLRPVADWKDADVFTSADAPVVDVPWLRTLVLRVPLTEFVAERKPALLGASLLLVASCAAQAGIEPVLMDGVEQSPRLQAVPGRARSLLLDHQAVVDALLDVDDQQSFAQLRYRS